MWLKFPFRPGQKQPLPEAGGTALSGVLVQASSGSVQPVMPFSAPGFTSRFLPLSGAWAAVTSFTDVSKISLLSSSFQYPV